MQDAERECEVERVIVKRDIADAGKVKANVAAAGKICASDREGIFAGIQQMQMADSWCDHHRPAPAAASDIDADRIRRQLVPREDTKVGLEDRLAIGRRKFAFALTERR